ncbi:polymorphic toxin-type HINT domain-containing protein [Shewanella frigidimarina]|uniref:polymorphic toxin-type HINT domain-containing protein n=1 Tax=Shewanella frigidimarina TaxID=56812 RepID=UPI003D7948E5
MFKINFVSREINPIKQLFGSVAKDMIEIEYSIGELETSMLVVEEHRFYLITKEWIKAVELNVGDQILACSDAIAKIESINKVEGSAHCRDLKISHNHNYFVTTARPAFHDTLCERAPIDKLERIAYELANRPSNFPDGKPTGHHGGPWVAARYLHCDLSKEVIGWGRANDNMCAEDAAVSDLRQKVADAIGVIELHRGNVDISHAYLRKYTKKGRFVNKMSPCVYCRDNYGSALNDTTEGVSNLPKDGRDYLPPVDK